MTALKWVTPSEVIEVISEEYTPMTNLLEQAINCNDGDQAGKIIQHALGVESDDVADYVFPKTWLADREQRARIIDDWLWIEARFLV